VGENKYITWHDVIRSAKCPKRKKGEDEAAGRKEAEEKCPKRKKAEDEAAGRKMAEDQVSKRKEAEEECPGKRGYVKATG
jgi:hypothetical protein